MLRKQYKDVVDVWIELISNCNLHKCLDIAINWLYKLNTFGIKSTFLHVQPAVWSTVILYCTTNYSEALNGCPTQNEMSKSDSVISLVDHSISYIDVDQNRPIVVALLLLIAKENIN